MGSEYFLGKGTGDLNIRAKIGTFVSERYGLEDCYYFDPQTSDRGWYSVERGSATITYGDNGCTITGTVAVDTYVRNTALSLPSEYVATCDITDVKGYGNTDEKFCGGLCFDDWFTDWQTVHNKSKTYRLSTATRLCSNLSKISPNDVLKVVREGDTMKQYINDILISTDNDINHTGYFQHRTYKMSGYNGRTITVKNLKIKPL